MDILRRLNPGVRKIKPYTPGKRIEEVKQELGLDRMVKMSSNENAYHSSPRAAEALRELADKVYTYPDALSMDFARKAAQQNGVAVDEITVGNGADGVLRNLCQTMVDEGDEIIIPEITFPIYRSNVEIMRGTIVQSAMKELHIDTEDILARITSRSKMIFLCNPNNPTGHSLEAETVRSFLHRVPDEVVVVLDEAYVDFADADHDPGSAEIFREGMENLFIVRSLSKTYGLAGLRLGYGIGNRELISCINRVKPPFDVSLAAQTAGSAAIEDRAFYTDVVEKTIRERERFRKRLEELHLHYVESQTNFFLLDTGTDSQQVFEELQKRGFIVRPGKNFGLETHIRVTLGTPEENEGFFRALEEVVDRRDRK